MAYLNLDLDYFDHPKTKRLVGLLGRGSDGLPIRLWCYCGKYHAETGDLTGYSPTDLESLIGWWGQPGKCIDALVQFKFIDKTDAGFQIHDWKEINGHIQALKDRAQAGAKARWEKARADAKAMLEHSLSNAGSNAPSFPSLEEEKKKKKDIENKLNDIGPEHFMPAVEPPNIPATLATLQKANEFAFLSDGSYPFLDQPMFSTDWAAWLAMRRRQKWDNGPRAMVLALNKLHKWPLEKAVLSLQLSVERSYRGVFEPKEESNGSQNGGGRGHSGGYESAQQKRDKRLVEISRRGIVPPEGHGGVDHPALCLGPEGNPI